MRGMSLHPPFSWHRANNFGCLAQLLYLSSRRLAIIALHYPAACISMRAFFYIFDSKSGISVWIYSNLSILPPFIWLFLDDENSRFPRVLDIAATFQTFVVTYFKNK